MKKLLCTLLVTCSLSVIGQHNPTDNLIVTYLQSCKAESYKAYMEANKGIETLGARLGNYHQKALKYFEQSISLDPSYCDAYYLAGSMNRILGNYDEAITLARKSLEINENPSAWIVLGNSYLMTKEYDLANEAFGKAMALVPTYIDSYYGQAYASYKVGNWEAVKNQIEEAMSNTDIVPYYRAKVNVLLGKAYFKLDDSRALDVLSSAKASLSNDGEATYMLGKLYLSQGDIKKATKLILEAQQLGIEVEPTDLEKLK